MHFSCVALGCLTSVAALSAPTSTATTRAHFLSSAAAAFGSGFVLATDPATCQAKMTETVGSNNPRYIDKEVEMKYGEGPDGNPRTRGVLVRRITGDATPYSFPVDPVRLVREWPVEAPFTPEDFFRADQGDDDIFYRLPRFVYHIDEPAVASLTQYYRNTIPQGADVLDICSSWVS
jgi:hypothetical protein